MSAPQLPQSEWQFQWEHYYDDSEHLFWQWIYPNTVETFRGKTVIDAGCGGGQHLNLVAPYAAAVTGLDLNTAAIARRHTAQRSNVTVLTGDIAVIALTPMDVVYCIGVIQHTLDPDRTFQNLKRLVKPGGRLILWCYSREGNWPNRLVLEPFKKLFLLRLPKPVLNAVALVLTLCLYPVVYTVYLLPLRWLTYHQYFKNWRQLSFRRNQLNVFDKLNAPLTHFIPRAQVAGWFNSADFTNVHLDHYQGVSWRASGTRRSPVE